MESSPLLPKAGGSATIVIPKSIGQEFRGLSSMALQVSLATVSRIMLTAIDSVFLGHLGVKELAAASLAQVWTSAPLMAVWASASALITLCGQSWGAGNRELTGIWLQFGLLISTVLSLPVFLWYWSVGFVLDYSTDDADVVALATTFARVLSFSIMPTLIYSCLRQYLQAMSILIPTTIVGVLSIAVAISGNYIFIYGIGGWSGLGFVGSPLSTVVAAWFQPCALFAYAFVYKRHHVQAWNGWDRSALTVCRLRAFVSIAGPIAGNSFISNVAIALISLVAAKLGPETIAANAVISGMWSLLWALFWGYGCATQVRIANYLGAGDSTAAKRVACLGLSCTLVVVILLAIATHYLDRQIISVYSGDDALITKCLPVLPIFIFAFVLESVEMTLGGVLTGMGQVRVTFWASTIATWLVQLPVAYVGALTLGYGFSALWVGEFVMELFKACVYIVALWRVDWEKMSERAVSAMEAAPERTHKQVEKGAVNYITAVVGSQPTGYIASMPEPRTPPLTSLFARQQRMARVTQITRRCVSHEPTRASKGIINQSNCTVREM